MALLRCDFFSDVLRLSTSMTVILPQSTSGQIGMTGHRPSGDSPLLYLLHGLSDDDTIWTRRTSIERYVAPLGLAVVMPQVNRSYYADESRGNRYWTFLSEELPAIVHGFFRLSRRREDTFVAGLSMGGYGAMKWALRDPGRFAAAASMSGALDAAAQQRFTANQSELTDRIFGGPVEGTDNDLFALLKTIDPSAAPALSVCCGTADPLFEHNQSFVQALRDKHFAVTSDFGPGDHDWRYWDTKIQQVLAWLPLHPTAGEPADHRP